MVFNPRLGDAPIEPSYLDKMNVLASVIDEQFNGDRPEDEAGRKAWIKARKTGFVLLVFPFGEVSGGRCNFISNGADRRDVVVLMKEMIARFEGQPETKGRA